MESYKIHLNKKIRKHTQLRLDMDNLVVYTENGVEVGYMTVEVEIDLDDISQHDLYDVRLLGNKLATIHKIGTTSGKLTFALQRA